MTDTAGFPPFKNARPKGSETGRLPPGPSHIEEIPRETARPDTPEINYQPQPITVCAKCGSREVREAVLIGDEVYVKL